MYIGQTTQTVEKRLHRHFMSATKGSNFNIHQAMRKYGFEKFEIEELECIESNTPQELISDLNVLEQFYIKYYDTKHNGYNMTDGGEGTRGRIYSEKERGCFISRMKRLWDNKEYCNHLSDAAVKRFANNSERQNNLKELKLFILKTHFLRKKLN
jgi:group I intron endonuclease